MDTPLHTTGVIGAGTMGSCIAQVGALAGLSGVLDAVAQDDAILAINTSWISIAKLGAAMRRPARFAY